MRDLPKSRLGVDLTPLAPNKIVPENSKKKARLLRREAKSAPRVWLATDLDREGEAIAWHLADIINVPKSKVKRVTFHEITPAAIKQAFKHPREIDQERVKRQHPRPGVGRRLGLRAS